MFSLYNLTRSGTLTGRVNWLRSQNANGLEQVWTAVLARVPSWRRWDRRAICRYPYRFRLFVCSL